MRVQSKKGKAKPRFGIVVGRFNEFIGQRLLKACLAEFAKQGYSQKDVDVVWVPGSMEIPVVALKFARRKKIAGVICLGAIIRGETFHFELVSREVASGIMRVSLDTGKPIIFGVLTTDTIDQAYKRSEEKGDNKGREAVHAVLEMTQVLSLS